MDNILIYLDNCSFNRPYDDQSSIKVKLETDAKLYIQELILKRKINLAWSYILEFENKVNPYKNKREQIVAWKYISVKTIYETKNIRNLANDFTKRGIKKMDSLHLACAIELGCDYFITTDYNLIKKSKDIKIKVLNPIDFVRLLEE